MTVNDCNTESLDLVGLGVDRVSVHFLHVGSYQSPLPTTGAELCRTQGGIFTNPGEAYTTNNFKFRLATIRTFF